MPPSPNKLALFWQELKRRRVTRLVTIYAVVGLGVIEAVDIIGGRFQIPEWTIQFMIILIIGGFPIAVILGWIFDLTSKGIERTQPLSPEQKASLPSLTWRPSWISIILFMMLISLAVAFFTVPRANALGFQERDWILIADLENNTSDEVFDRSLLHAISVTIDQSKYVNIFPRKRVLEVLQRMQIDSIGKNDVPLALEIAERENIKSVLSLTISELNNTYILSTRLLDPSTGATVRSRQVKAIGKEEILQALDELATTVRRDLGESLRKVLQRKVPLIRATTPSLDALKLYTEGAVAWRQNRWREAQTLWTHAVQIDSGFAWANASLGLAAGWLDSEEAAQRHFDRALNQLDRVTEKERLWITALAVKGQQAVDAYQTYLQQYPDNRDGWYNLGNSLRDVGRLEDAMEAYLQVLTIDPMQFWAHTNLGVGYDYLGRFKEAAIHFERSFKINPNEMMQWRGDVNRISGFVLVKMGDLIGASERFDLLSNREEGARANGLRSQALLKMYQGYHSSAIELLEQAVVLNQRNKAPLSEFRNRMYLARAYQTKGMSASLVQELTLGQKIAEEEGGWTPEWTIHLAIRQLSAGDTLNARAWLESWIESDTAREYSEWVELLRGEIALAEGNLSEAVVSIELADQLLQPEQGLLKEALGRAYHANGQLEQSVNAFMEAIRLTHLGAESQEPWILAHYRLGLVLEEMGETDKSRVYLARFLELWGSGNEDLLGVADARRRLH
jgi:tetratricopeptide (TPR) repeat protein